MKKIAIPIIIAIIFCMTAGSAFAITLSSYNPIFKTKAIPNNAYSNARGTFNGKIGATPNGKSQTLIPNKTAFHRGVFRNPAIKKSTKILKGTRLSNAKATAFGRHWHGKKYSVTNKDPYMWFPASTKPKIEYHGYQIWDDSQDTFIPIIVQAELVGYSASHISKASKGVTPSIGFINSNNGYHFYGLPSVRLMAIGNVHIKFTYYKAKPDGSKGFSYQIKQNVTYHDIDVMQAISTGTNDTKGYTAHNNAKKKLKFGKIGAYSAVNANTHKNIKNDSNGYWMCWHIETDRDGVFDVIYTSNQEKVVNGAAKDAAGKPNGGWTELRTTTYTKDPTLKLDKPYKRVYDNVPKDDVNKNGTHNKLNKISQEFYYEIHQPITGGMQYGAKYSLSSLVFYDKTDSCVKITKTPTFKATINGTDKDVTKYFTKQTYTSNVVKYSLKNTKEAHKAIYKSTKVKMIVDAKVNVGEETLATHNNHKIKNKLLYDIPNLATVSYTPKGGKNKSQNTNTVQTRVQGTPKHDLSITKNVTDDALPVDTNKAFAFQIKLTNGSKYKWEIKKGSTVVKSGETAFNKGYTAQIKHGETFTIKQIPGSVTYNIKEEMPEHYRVTVTKGTNSATTDTISGSEVSGTIKDVQNNDAISYTYRNTHEVSEHILRVKKQVNGENGTFPFTIKLSGLKPGENYKSFPTEEDYYAYNDFTTMGYGYPDYSFSNNIATSDGKLTINVNLSDGEEFLLTGIPDTAKYQIIEGETAGYKATFETIDRENPQVLPDIGQTVHMLPNTDYTGVKTKTGTGEKGKGVNTPEETFTVTGHAYTREYLVTNSEENSHELVLHKKLEGGNPDDEFNFSVKFTGLKGKTIGAQIFESDDEEEPFNSIPIRNTSESVYTQEFVLKANQYMVFLNIPENAKYEVTEVNNDYIASYTGVRIDKDGVKENFNGSNDKPNKDLTFGETLPEGNTKTEYDITNTAVSEPERTSLEVEKVTTDASKDKFNFTANFENLEPNHTYAVFSETGDTEYEVVNDNGTIVVRTGLGTIGNPHEFVNGVPIIVKRANGKERTIFSGVSDNLADLDGWHKGTYTLSPAVGTVMTGEFVSFTANDSGEATVNFKGSNDKTATFSGLPVGTKYKVSELANSFAPAYQVIRGKETLDKGDGEAGQDLQMSKVLTLTKETDKVKFVNDKRSHMLRTEKKVEGGTDQFDFTATIKNLTKEWYMAMVPGEGNFELGMNSQGIKITASNYSGSIKDIPIKLIRPIDGAERVFYTDENGLVPKSEFEKWLSKGQDGSYKFKLEWNGGYVNGSFESED